MKELYRLIDKKKLTSPQNIISFCEKCSIEEIIETVSEAFAYSNSPKDKLMQASPFNFSSSITLSGGEYPCASPSCRIERVNDLAKFSAIYSSSTTIHNPFDFIYYVISPEQHPINVSDEEIRRETFIAFMIAQEFKPLIEARVLNFSRTLYLICKECKIKRDNETKSIKKKLDQIAKKNLFPLLKDRVALELKQKDKYFHLSGIDELIGEDLYFHYLKFPEFLIGTNGKKITDIHQLKNSNPLVKQLFDNAIESLMVQKISDLEKITKTYLTNSLFEKILLEEMGKKSEDKVLNFFLEDVPVIQTIPYERVLEMRQKHSDEFSSFQDEVSIVMDKAKSFETQTEFNEYVKDKLQSQLNDIKKIQEKQRKKNLLKGVLQGAFLGASIAISLKTNGQVPALLGVAQASYGCSNLLSQVGDFENRLRKSPMYFYYRLFKKL